MIKMKIISAIGIFLMTAAIIFGFVQGNFSEEGSILLKMPWGIVSMIDLYVGFTLFSCWIWYREKELWKKFTWIFLMMTLGFFTGSLYVFLALMKSKGNWKKFFMGYRT